MRHPIRFDSWYGVLSTLVGLPPSTAYLEVTAQEVAVRMGWAFRCRFPRTAIESVAEPDMSPLSRGVHGFGGRWLVNGSGRGLVALGLRPGQRGYVMGFPVRLELLLVSVADPAALRRTLGRPA